MPFTIQKFASSYFFPRDNTMSNVIISNTINEQISKLSKFDITENLFPKTCDFFVWWFRFLCRKILHVISVYERKLCYGIILVELRKF